ncbi:D-alanyl-D-alanine carboxypeptidase family protein [Clostridium sp.]|uniref:D-alanyl-D-alanine carboxypeptidase family protein n=1 Tax=Clostridium sp. TaxID=1506 RepID=UPI001A50755A|nr:D-alanyl-D-alanine carboxypeptidase family protein [Clostridium sp.]MBK5240134.1 D-alanyl-D-alanine carboxypeptidase [Clostridium sp.]
MKRRSNIILFTLAFTIIFSTTVFAAEKPLNLIGKAAVSVDLETNEIIYTKNIDNKMYPASITKLITALLLAENMKITDNLTYTALAKAQPPFTYNANLHPVAVGDTMSADNVMDALLLFSGNDIAYMISDNVGKTTPEFIKMMNKKAVSLGMTGSHFVTPNGLDDMTDEHYTTAYDITLLGKAAYNNEWVKKSMAKKTSTVKFSNGPEAPIENRNKLLGIDGNVGGKTGLTDKAGRCLVSIYERDGRKIIGVVMKSEDDDKDTKVFEDMTKLIDYSYAAKKEVLNKKDTELKTISVPYKVIPFIGPEKTIDIPLTAKEDLTYYNNDVKPEIAFNVSGINPWKLDKETSVGTLDLIQRDSKISFELYPTISKSTLIKDNIIIYAGAAIVLIALIVLIIFLISFIKRKNNRGGSRIRF